MGMRGVWEDEQTFVLEINQIANYRVSELTMRFVGDTVTLSVAELTHEAVTEITGTAAED